jgi:small subunit ribosomal protein S7
MNKNLSKNSPKSLRVYILSEIRERRKLSGKNQKSFPPKSSSHIRSAKTPLVHGSFRNRSARPAQFEKVFPKIFPRTSVGSVQKTLTVRKTLVPPVFSGSKTLAKKKVYPKVGFAKNAKKLTGLKHPCLFVGKVDQKTQEVIGSRFINKMIRFITKQGKKSLASESMNKVRSILTNFEADRKDFKKKQKIQGLHQPPIKLKSPNENLEQNKISSKIETYKSRKLSQFLSRQKLKSSENFRKQLKKNVKSLKKTPKKKKLGYSPLSPRVLIEQAISSVKPFVEVKKVRVAGSTYQVPAILKKHRQENYAMKWILQSALERSKKNRSQSFEYCLAFEIYEASKKQGQARMKRNELHKLAESHRAFAHFRWW